MTKILDSFGALAEEFAAGSLRVLAARERAMDGATKIIQHDAQERIGHYQAAVGPFNEWAPLAESTEAEKARLGYPLDAPLLREGDLRDSIEREFSASEGIVGSKDPVMRYQELGTPTIPPRPVIGPAALASRKKVRKLIGKTVVGAFCNEVSIYPSLDHDMNVN